MVNDRAEIRTLRVMRVTTWLAYASGAGFLAIAVWSLLPGHGPAYGAPALALACLAVGRVTALDRRLRIQSRNLAALLRKLNEGE